MDIRPWNLVALLIVAWGIYLSLSGTELFPAGTGSEAMKIGLLLAIWIELKSRPPGRD